MGASVVKVMSNEACAQQVVTFLAAGVDDMGTLSEDLIMTCLNLNSKDNMTASVILLPAAKSIFRTVVQERRRPRWRVG